MVYMGARVFQDDFAQSFPMEVCFVPMFRDKEETGIIIAEKATFNSLADLLRTELYRGHVLGNTPLRCRHGSIWRFHMQQFTPAFHEFSGGFLRCIATWLWL